jgi:hypothetical protein
MNHTVWGFGLMVPKQNPLCRTFLSAVTVGRRFCGPAAELNQLELQLFGPEAM